jgi:hypothetical protein
VGNRFVWIDLSVGSELAMVVIGSAVWAAAVIRRKFLEGSIIERKLRGLDIANEALEALTGGLKRQIEQLLDAESRAVFDKHYTESKDPEQIGRIRFSIRTLAELIARGAEIHPSLYAPEQAANVFPDMAKLNTLASQISQLEDTQEPPPSDSTLGAGEAPERVV